jgi:uncharacterized membrane protein YkoI
MRRRLVWILASLVVAGAIAGGAIAIASNDSEGGASGPQADRAVEAALEATGGGTANAVERDDENGATWEVEVTKPNGQTVDVRLDENYQVVVIEGDDEAPDDDDGSD